MVIETKDLGFVEIDERDIIRFPHGIYGFEKASRYILLKKNKDSANPFMWLQCVDSKNPCFVVIDPGRLFHNYEPEIAPDAVQAIGLRSPGDLRLLVIAAVPHDIEKVNVNLRCPIVINAVDNIALQVILEDDKYLMKYYLMNKGRDSDARADAPGR